MCFWEQYEFFSLLKLKIIGYWDTIGGLVFLKSKPYFLKCTILWANVTTYKTTGSKATIIGIETQVAQLVNNLPANAGDLRDVGSVPGSGRSPGVGNGNPLQNSCLGNSMDRGA